MSLGCLTGNGKATQIDGSYSYQQRGRSEAFPPDLKADKAGADGAIGFSAGSLTDGDASTQIGWIGNTVGEMGADIVIDLKGPYFVDRVVLRQAGREVEEKPTAVKYGNVAIGEVPDYVEHAGVNCVEVYARTDDGELILAGRLGQRRQGKAMDEKVLSVGVGMEATELVVRMDSFNRDILLVGLEVWGASIDEPKVYPIPQKMTFDGKGVFKLPNSPKILVGKDASDDTLFAATLLVEKINENLGLTSEIVRDGDGDVVLGKSGLNFGAGMTGGFAYVLDIDRDFVDRYNHELIDIHHITPETMETHLHHLRGLLATHVEATGSVWGEAILEDYRTYLPKFWVVKPKATELSSLIESLRRAA